MHELAIAESIAEGVTRHAQECRAQRVTSVRVQIGAASGIVNDSLAFSFEMIAAMEPLLSGARLLIERVPHRARCRHCQQEFAVIHFIAQCPACETWDTDIISGTELRVLDMEIEASKE
jgi:hydrogenase nickel incorporation protein HypA/HybF